MPTINFCLGWLVFHESLPPSRLVGFALVWVGLAIATVDAARRSRIKIGRWLNPFLSRNQAHWCPTEGTTMKRSLPALLASIAALGPVVGMRGRRQGDRTDQRQCTDRHTAARTTADTDAADATGGLICRTPLLRNVSVRLHRARKQMIDQMIAQFEAAGMKVDKECFTALLSDEALREMVAAGGQGTPIAGADPEVLRLHVGERLI